MKGVASEEEVPKQQREILQLLAEAGACETSQVADAMSIKRALAEHLLEELGSRLLVSVSYTAETDFHEPQSFWELNRDGRAYLAKRGLLD